MARFTATVHFEFENSVSVRDAKAYLISAVLSECGLKHPDDPLASLIRQSVDVKCEMVRGA